MSIDGGRPAPAAPPARLRVWDLPVRLLHGSLVACVLGAWLTRHRLGELHQYFGYGALAAASLRLVWGFVGGSRYARFTQFVRRALPTLAYARAVLAGHAPRYLGHNPLGGWMVVALLACVGALGFTGWLYTTDMFWGYGWLAMLHEGLAWTLLAMVALHVGGVVFTSWQHRENLVEAMVTGDKPQAQPGDVV